ncbi:MAG: glycoside hydrolase family 5 protein [Lachnospiraceae bacterium]|nr:glycoside hydrolase family 5 protein [Lachnospiraceae bacterium]
MKKSVGLMLACMMLATMISGCRRQVNVEAVESLTTKPTEATATIEPTNVEPTIDEITSGEATEMTTTEEGNVETVTTETATTEAPTTETVTTETPTTEAPTTEVVNTETTTAGNTITESGLGFYGALNVRDGRLVDSNGNPVLLRGISTMGLQWYGQYVSKETLEFLKNTSGMNVIRLAMYTAEGGYCHKDANGKTELEALIDKGVQAAIELDMYVIIDWHILSDGNPNTYKEEAKTFLNKMSKKYAGFDNVIYEICNEPNGGTGWNDIKAYANEVIPVIRNNDSDAIVLVGTPTWSQEIDKAMADPLAFDNVMYTLHFYADTHRDYLRERLRTALEANIPVFISEFGICDASGNGSINESEADKWDALMDEYGLSWCIWNLSNKNEASALIASWCNKLYGWSYDEWSQSGKWFLKVMGK